MGLLISGFLKEKIDAKFPKCQHEATFELKMNLIDLVLRMNQELSHSLKLS
jgi:hypothetical protein